MILGAWQKGEGRQLAALCQGSEPAGCQFEKPALICASMRTYLVDNGSLRAESVLNLRRVAAELSQLSGQEIIPASLLHSSRVDPQLLNGEPAVNLERRMRLDYAAGEREFRILPFFFGPTAAIKQYLPERLAFLREKFGPMAVGCYPFLFPGYAQDHDDLLRILSDNIVSKLQQCGWLRPAVVLVDHGSPLPEVAAVRDHLAACLNARLGDCVDGVVGASMERRDGDAYAFNEPLLAKILRGPNLRQRQVIVAMLFLSPGRHAGLGGDVDQICAAAEAECPQLQTHMTKLVGNHPDITA